jgi:hypothetical protein
MAQIVLTFSTAEPRLSTQWLSPARSTILVSALMSQYVPLWPMKLGTIIKKGLQESGFARKGRRKCRAIDCLAQVINFHRLVCLLHVLDTSPTARLTTRTYPERAQYVH